MYAICLKNHSTPVIQLYVEGWAWAVFKTREEAEADLAGSVRSVLCTVGKPLSEAEPAEEIRPLTVWMRSGMKLAGYQHRQNFGRYLGYAQRSEVRDGVLHAAGAL